MPLKRKVCKIGTGYAIFLPKSWVDLNVEKQGVPLHFVTLEVNGVLKIAPFFENNGVGGNP